MGGVVVRWSLDSVQILCNVSAKRKCFGSRFAYRQMTTLSKRGGNWGEPAGALAFTHCLPG